MTKRQHRELLKRCSAALDDWLRSYAPEFVDKKYLKESSERVYAAGGALAYIADLQAEIRKALL